MTAKLSDKLSVKGRFHRSVHLSGDWNRGGALTDYLLTPTISELASFILSELGREKGMRAWSITGPYGSGKSAFALFLADCLCSKTPTLEAERLARKSRLGSQPFAPVLITAERGPLAPLLTEGLRGISGSTGGRGSNVKKEVTRRGSVRTVEALAQLLVQAAASQRRRRKAGILLVIDELGKFLEYASLNPDDADVFVLQQLAEAAARSEVPVLFLTVLHSGFADYLPPDEELRRTEWQKVQGRFQDVPFQLPAEQVLELVGSAIQQPARGRLQSSWKAELDSILQSADFIEAADRLSHPELLRKCFPLHPLAATLLWPLFRSKGAQNERSLFGFLSSDEPLGFMDFLRTADATADPPGLYRLPQLYDYLVTALGMGAFRGEQARRWSLIDQSLNRLPSDAPAAVADVLKVVGLLSTYGSQVGVQPTAGILELSIGNGPSVREAVEFLTDHSYMVYRRHLKAYALWEGSDFDAQAAFQDAMAKVRRGGPFSKRLRAMFDVRPVVPRKYYITTGTLRYLETVLVDGEEPAIKSATTTGSGSDGKLLVIMPGRRVDRRKLIAWCKESSQASAFGSVVFAVAKRGVEIEARLQDVEAWRWVLDNRLELASDPVARQEVRSLLHESRRRLSELVGPILGLPGYRINPSLSTWIHAGEISRPSSSVALQRWFSNILQLVYGKAPQLKNELLNRETLSSSASGARRTLIERMLTHSNAARLGIEGFPPEASMYESMLRDSGIHAQRDGVWSLGRPRGTWGPVWRAVERFLTRSKDSRRPLLELVAELKAPPIGLREGPLPVLIVAVLIAKGEEVSLYEDGVFVPELRVEVLERLLRRKETFELRSHKLSAAQTMAVHAVGSVIEKELPAAVESGEQVQSLVAAVRSLVLFASKLPPYVRQTRRLEGEHTAALRDQLLTATDPAQLLLKDMPIACGVSRLDKNSVPIFTERLSSSVRELGRAYRRLVDEIEQYVVTNFGLPRESQSAQARLQQRSSVVADIVAEPRLLVFVKEAARATRTIDWVERLARATNEGMPPSHWRDTDVAKFQLRLRELAGEFERLEELASEQRRTGAPRVLRFGMLSSTGPELRKVIPIRSDDDPEVTELVDRIAGVLESREFSSEDDRRIQLEALGRVAAGLLAADVSEEVTS